MTNGKDLKNPDHLRINGELFQVIDNIAIWYEKRMEDYEMAVTLVKVKVSNSHLLPDYRITYYRKHPSHLTFWHYDSQSGRWLQEGLHTIRKVKKG